MSDGDALLRAVIENPADDGPRLVYADWLEERGNTKRAAFIRIQCEMGEWSRVYDPNPTHGTPRADRLVHRDGRERDSSDSDWLRLLQVERELAERYWITWLRPLLDFFRATAHSDSTEPPRFRFLRQFFRRPDSPFGLSYDANNAPLQSCQFHRPNAAFDRQYALVRVAFTRGFVGVVDLGSRVTAQQIQYLFAQHPVEILGLKSPSAAAVAKGAGRLVPLRNLWIEHAELAALRTILTGNSDFCPRQLTIMDRTCPAELVHLLADSPVAAKLETLGLIFTEYNRGFTPEDARILARNPHLRHLRNGSVVFVADPIGNETVGILTERFGAPQMRAGFGYEFRLAPAESSGSTSAPEPG
jgi:uncharacterized protein (TIGR02996 family)